MKKIIRIADEKQGIVQITTADERWYLKPSTDPITQLPVFKPVPSSTWVASYWPKGIGYYRWLADKGWDEAQAIKEAAGDKGSAVHAALEMILNGQEFRIDTKVLDKNKSTEQEPALRELTYDELICVKAFLDWKTEIAADYRIETIATETNVFSDIHSFAGTLDWLLRLTPRPEGKNPLKLAGPTVYLTDFKTSQDIWDSHELQISSYGETITNGENPIFERNENGTESNKLLDVSSLRLAILQIGYRRNKDGFKFSEIANRFDDFKVAQHIWRREHTSAKSGELNKPGFTQRDFPIVLSPAKAAPQRSRRRKSKSQRKELKALQENHQNKLYGN